MLCKCLQKGFSIIELLVTLAIATLVVSAVLVRFDVFDSVVVLKSLAYEVALTVREAQVFSVSTIGDSTGTFDTPYGVYFSEATPQQYVLFEDDGDLVYDADDTILETYEMNAKYELRDLCADATCGRTDLSLVFQRPEFDPIITVAPAVANPTSARIQLGIQEDTATTFSVVVGLTGQVSVEAP